LTDPPSTASTANHYAGLVNVLMSNAWSRFYEGAARSAKSFRDGVGRADPDLRAFLGTLVASTLSAQPPTSLDAEVEGARLTLAGPPARYDAEALFEPLVAFWAEAAGADFALEATLRSLAYGRRTPDNYVDYDVWLERLPRPSIEDQGYLPPHWTCLRAALARAPAEQRVRAMTLARAARQGASLMLRAALAFSLPDDVALWTPEDSAEAMTTPVRHWLMPRYVVSAELRQSPLADGIGDTLPEAEDIGRVMGERGLVALRVTLVLSPSGSHAQTVGALGTPAAFSLLADHAQSRYVTAPLALAMRAHPRAAFAGLLPRVARSAGKSEPTLNPVARGLLLSLVAADPALAREAPAELARHAASLVSESGADASEASEAELPPSLARPPWREPKPAKRSAKGATSVAPKGEASARAARPNVVAGTPPTPLPYEERLAWGKRDPKSLVYVEPDVSPEKDAEELARFAKDRADSETIFLFQVRSLTDAGARTMLAETPLKQLYGDPGDLEVLLARLGLEILDWALAFVRSRPDRFPALKVADSPRVAPLAAHVFANNKKVGESAEAWLLAYPRAAAVGLVPALATETGKAREPIAQALRLLASKHPAILDEVVRAYGPAWPDQVAAILGASDRPKAPAKEPKLPPFFRPDVLPRPTLAERGEASRALSAAAMTDLARWLAGSEPGRPQPALSEIARALDPASLARFAWGLFTEWLIAGGPPKEGWAFRALGIFGDAACARALTPLARTWAPEGLPQRAQAAVDVLAAMGHDAALLGIHQLAAARSRALAAHAEKMLGRVAAVRGLTRDEIADRLVPDLGLEPDGSKTLSYGSRSFSVRFDEQLRPSVVDPSGHAHDDLPKPTRHDDAELAAGALEAWRDIKKRARSIAAEQARRLEAAMVTQRRFSVEHFETFFAKHPLVGHLARRLLWGLYADGRFVQGLRVAEDGSYAGQSDDEIRPSSDALVGVPHPLELTQSELGAWGAIFGDYEILQPFDQLSRTVYPLRAEDKDAQSFSDVLGHDVASTKLLGLERRGWKRGAAGDGGVFAYMEKPFGERRAVVTFEPGIYLGDPSMHPVQRLGEAAVLEGDEPLPQRSIGAIVGSELRRDLASLVE
jgi:hypothetical protein